jgi:hypothetical protein
MPRLRTSTILGFDPVTNRLRDEVITIILGPASDEDGDFLVQKEDGSFWLFAGCPDKGWFGGYRSNWEAK